MTPQARDIVREVAAQYGVDEARILGKCRKEKVFRARIEIAKRLDARGYSTPRIGAILNKDHTTILFYLGRISGQKPTPPKKPKWRKPHVRHLYFVRPRPLPEKRKFYLIPYVGAYMPEYEWKERPHG